MRKKRISFFFSHDSLYPFFSPSHFRSKSEKWNPTFFFQNFPTNFIKIHTISQFNSQINIPLSILFFPLSISLSLSPLGSDGGVGQGGVSRQGSAAAAAANSRQGKVGGAEVRTASRTVGDDVNEGEGVL